MITAFLITTLVYFSITIVLNILTIALVTIINEGNNGIPIITIISLLITLGMITFNIFALVSL